MQSPKALIQAASESASSVDERYVGYREELVRRLATLIQTQDEFGTPAGRRTQVENTIAAIAELFSVKLGSPRNEA